jgi:hypothetical protein
MSKDEGGEGFLSRWSKRKAEVRQQEQKPAAEVAAPPAAEQQDEEIDLATLPSIESLTADSDFSVFLKKGVPLALRNAALRKLWLTEPSVVNYKALVEYNWDFTAPGYGDLLPTDNIAKMAQQVFSGFSQTPATEDAPPAAPAEVSASQQEALPEPEEPAVATAPITGPVTEEGPVGQSPAEAESMPLPRRRHGGALPS